VDDEFSSRHIPVVVPVFVVVLYFGVVIGSFSPSGVDECSYFSREYYGGHLSHLLGVYDFGSSLAFEREGFIPSSLLVWNSGPLELLPVDVVGDFVGHLNHPSWEPWNYYLSGGFESDGYFRYKGVSSVYDFFPVGVGCCVYH